MLHNSKTFVTGFWKTNQNITLGLSAQLMATLVHYPLTVPGLADWSAFPEQVLLTM